MFVLLIAIITFISTFVGGLFALKYIKKINLIIAVTAGVILGLLVFDVIPEVFDLAKTNEVSFLIPILFILLGFFIFHAIENLFLIHSCGDKNYNKHQHTHLGVISSTLLIIHSFLDGVGIGTSLNISFALGVLVAVAVIGHDFADGVNTVSLLLLHNNTKKRAIYFLIIDSVAPILGLLVSLYVQLPLLFVLLYLSYFTGSLLYIAFSEIIPQAHANNGFIKTFLLTLFGLIFMGLLSYITNILI